MAFHSFSTARDSRLRGETQLEHTKEALRGLAMDGDFGFENGMLFGYKLPLLAFNDKQIIA
jgi:hypothetical protein